MWSWYYDDISNCLISFVWVNSCKCTCLLNLVIIDLIEMKISILRSILTWILLKKLSSLSRSAIWRDFKIRKSDLKFRSLRYGWQKNEKKEKNNRGNYKVFCVSWKPNNLSFGKNVLFLFFTLNLTFFNN